MPRIHFNEVVTRDGFQDEAAFLPTVAQLALIDQVGACGCAKIEVISFSSAKAGLITDLHPAPAHVDELRKQHP
jgi:hydroxymethylglutaryl-CoA lyase